jgi:hypothetical protein
LTTGERGREREGGPTPGSNAGEGGVLSAGQEVRWMVLAPARLVPEVGPRSRPRPRSPAVNPLIPCQSRERAAARNWIVAGGPG